MNNQSSYYYKAYTINKEGDHFTVDGHKFATEALAEQYVDGQDDVSEFEVTRKAEAPKKYYICNDTSSVYWIDGEELAFASIMQNDTFDLSDPSYVEPELVGEEIVNLSNGETATLNEIFAKARKALA